ncbi:MAG: hypothetical protein ABI592_13715 [Acidobacteriota bacterium]
MPAVRLFRTRRWCLAAAALAGSLACAGTTPGRAAPPDTALSPIPAGSSKDGVVSYEALVDPAGTASRLKAQRDFFPAGPSPANEPPGYPANLLPRALGPREIVVRLVIDARGRVARVAPLPPSPGSAPAEPEFFDAVRAAVESWRFTPARLRRYEDVDDGSGAAPYQVLKSEQPVETYIDVRFLFEVREGIGIVSTPRGCGRGAGGRHPKRFEVVSRVGLEPTT